MKFIATKPQPSTFPLQKLFGYAVDIDLQEDGDGSFVAKGQSQNFCEETREGFAVLVFGRTQEETLEKFAQACTTLLSQREPNLYVQYVLAKSAHDALKGYADV